jgi:hypothetical protein
MEPNSSTNAQNESQQKATQAGDTPLKIQDFKVFASASTTLFLLIIGEEKTYIDYDDLANFLSNILQVADGWRRLQHVLGTSPTVFSHIERQVKADLSTITKAVFDLLCDWSGQTGLHESTVSLLCYGSAVPVGKVHTEGLKKHGFILTAGS